MSIDAETIAAVATANGPGGIGVVRVSGALALPIARALLGDEPLPRHAHFSAFRDADGETIDHGLLLVFPAPHSFTGEDVLELQAHGSPVGLRLLLARTIELGARAARPGEFSERAFHNGKIDLAQAEAIADLIASGSNAAARAAMRSLGGRFSTRVHALTEQVVRLRVWIEAAIDFPEEEIDFLAAPALADALATLLQDFAALLASTRRGVRLVNGLHAVILGRPNVGKSSLLNALAGSDRAIVTAVAGTTRDVLRETIDLDGIALTLADTAGLHESTDLVEREGIRRAHAERDRADLVLLVSDRADVDGDLDLLGDAAAGAACIVVHNKIDRDAVAAHQDVINGRTHIWLSAQSGDGLLLLANELKRHAGIDDADAGAFSARARHVEALETTGSHLHSAHHAMTTLRAGELAAEELRLAQQALADITGAFSSDDLLGRIFADFCIGK